MSEAGVGSHTETPYIDDFAVAARRSAAHTIKMQARRYAQRPSLLDTLHPGLSCSCPATLVAIAEHLVEREFRSPRRWFGFGGEVTLVNARAALLLGRARRQGERLHKDRPTALQAVP